MDTNRWLTEIAQSIADGTAIDWTVVRQNARSDDDNEILRRLQSIEQLVRAHRVLERTEPAGTHWGQLKILEKIGSGAHGDVYRAYDARLDRDVALKLLKTSQDQSGSRVVSEARMMAKLRHRGVAVVYGADTIGGKTGVWMELIDGCSLAEYVKSNGPLDGDDVARIGIDLCSAVIAINNAGLLHRDVKAQNVLIDRTGRVVLADFGTGREIVASKTTPHDNLVGTPIYLSPEVLAGDAHSAQSEVYALGALLHYIASASFPVSGRSLEQIRQMHAETRSVATRDAAPALPEEIAAVVETALEPSCAKRYSDASELRADLESAQLIRGRRLPRAVSCLVASRPHRMVIADTFLKASRNKRDRSSSNLRRWVSNVRACISVTLRIVVAGFLEIPVITGSWALGAWLWFALLPAALLYVLLAQFHHPAPSPEPVTIVCGVLVGNPVGFRFLLPLSFFFAIALPFRSKRPPIAALAIAGAGMAVGLKILIGSIATMDFIVTRVPSIVQCSERFRAVWTDRAILLIPGMVILAGQVRSATPTRHRFAMLCVPLLYFDGDAAARIAIGYLERLDGEMNDLTAWLTLIVIAILVAVPYWAQRSRTRA